VSLSRRHFLHVVPRIGAAWCAAAATSVPTAAIAPIRRTPGSRMKLSLAAYSFRQELTAPQRPMTLAQFVDLAVTYGLDAIEPTSYYFPEPVTPQYCRELRRLAFLQGLSISGTAIRNTFTYPPGPKLDREMAHVKMWVDRAVDLGAPVIRIFAGDRQEGTTEAQARRWCIDATQQAVEYAGQRGIILALENHGGIVSTADDLLAIVREIQSDWFGVNWDSGNFRGPDPYAELARIAPYAVTVQLKTEIAPGGGPPVEADLPRVVGILKSADYRGFVALEYEAKENPRTAVPRYLKQLRALIS
jgi:sugar phosphate isomerase/epimerase